MLAHLSHRLTVLTILAALFLLLAQQAAAAPAAARHPIKVGTIAAISSNSLTIHSKTHAADYTFVIDGTTRFLQHGQGEPRTSFKVGVYVSVSYTISGSKWIAYHVSLRRQQ